MRTTTRRTYKFSELGPKGRQRAIEDYRDEHPDWLFDEHDTSALTEMFETDLKDHYHLGNSFAVHWGLNYCQGDGVAFSGPIDLHLLREHDPVISQLFREMETTLCLREQQCVLGDVCFEASVANEGRECHWNSMTVYVEGGANDWQFIRDLGLDGIFDEFDRKLREYLEQRVKDISREMEKAGYADIEYHSSDECISERLESDDEDYYRSGEAVDGR